MTSTSGAQDASKTDGFYSPASSDIPCDIKDIMNRSEQRTNDSHVMLKEISCAPNDNRSRYGTAIASDSGSSVFSGGRRVTKTNTDTVTTIPVDDEEDTLPTEDDILSESALYDKHIFDDLRGITNEGLPCLDSSTDSLPSYPTGAELESDLQPSRVVSYRCETQPSSPTALLVGVGNDIPRWEMGSKLTFNVREGFPSDEVHFAVQALRNAATEWNSLRFGVTFHQVRDDEPAVFQLAYTKGSDTMLADAFFPGKDTDRTLLVTALSFKDTYRMSLSNIFLHELGHILGLRHEFAKAEDDYSVRFGEPDSKSVMNYHAHPSHHKLTDLDKSNIRRFYAWKKENHDGLQIRLYRPFTMSDGTVDVMELTGSGHDTN